MKQFFYFFVFLLFFQAFAFSQVPNSSFENWTGGNPDGWLANNAPGTVTPITQSNSSHTGSSAAKGEVESFSNILLPPVLISTDENGFGFPISVRYNSLKGYFKFNPVEGDRLVIFVFFSLNQEYIGGGAVEIETPIADYTEINIPIDYSAAGTPDTALIEITIIGPTGEDYHLGSEFYADDISLSEAVVGVDDNKPSPDVFNLAQNYPNPFNPSTTISYQIPERSEVSLKVYDILGTEVAQLVNETKEAGSYSVNFDASSLPSGVYMYSIQAGIYSASRKMILTK